MVSFTDRHFFLLAVLVYGLSTVYSVFLWRKGFRRDDRVNYVLLLLAFALHTTAMAQRGFSYHRCPVQGILEATMFLGWALVTAYLLVGLLPRLRFLGAFASPGLFAIGLFVVVFWNDPALGPRPQLPDQMKIPHLLTTLHATLALLAYGAFGLSAVAGIMYLTQERDLKFHKLRAVFSLLPPIQRLESITSCSLLVGFILLTTGLAVGVYGLAYLNNPHSYRGDPKIVWSVAIWAFYLGLVVMRWMTMNWRFLGGFILFGIGVSAVIGGTELAWQGFWEKLLHLVICLLWMGLGLARLQWRFALGGRRFTLCVVGIFTFVLLTFWGTNLDSPIHNP